MDISTCSRPVQCAQAWVASIVQPGDTVVDATAGNGHDSLFLAGLTGESGRVYIFDIQECALKATESRLREHAYSGEWISFYRESHALMEQWVPNGVKATMFNLGYLPGGDKSLISTVGETILALEAAMRLTVPGGIVTVVCYPGHEGGDEEAEAVEHLFARVSANKWRIARVSHWNAPSPSPFLLAAFRLR